MTSSLETDISSYRSRLSTPFNAFARVDPRTLQRLLASLSINSLIHVHPLHPFLPIHSLQPPRCLDLPSLLSFFFPDRPRPLLPADRRHRLSTRARDRTSRRQSGQRGTQSRRTGRADRLWDLDRARRREGGRDAPRGGHTVRPDTDTDHGRGVLSLSKCSLADHIDLQSSSSPLDPTLRQLSTSGH